MGDQFVTDNEFEDLMLEVYMNLPGADVELYCPVGGNCLKKYPDLCLHDDLANMIIHLNDEHKWPREEIADWVETLEEYIDLTFKESHDTATEDCSRK